MHLTKFADAASALLRSSCYFCRRRTGVKRWYMVKHVPGSLPATKGERVSQEEVVKREKMLCTISQRANEVIFLPHRTWHATYNIADEETVGISVFDTTYAAIVRRHPGARVAAAAARTKLRFRPF